MSNMNRAKYPNVSAGIQYAEDVVAGKIVACVYIKAACEKFLREIQDGYSERYHFDPERAEKYLRLVQRFAHPIGAWKTRNIIYEPWQKWIWSAIMGFVSDITGQRRYRIAHVDIGRGNAKSTMASQAALYFLCLDNPQGNQIATVATRKEQARIVLDSARAMASKNPSYLQNTGAKVLAHTIVHKQSNSFVRALSADHSGLDGLNDVLAICDELHAMKRETFDVIYSGMSKRNDSLTLCISTAGWNLDSVGYSQSEYAKKVALGEVDDEQFFAAVYTLDKDDDIYEESNWLKANPNFGVSVDADTFRAKANKTIETPSDLNNFKVKHLNMYISQAEQFFDADKWDLCADPNLKIEDFKGKHAKKGLDLASHIDLTAHSTVFRENGIYYIFERTFIPEATVREARSTLYDDAIARGHLFQTEGEAINYDYIREDIIKSSEPFRIDMCAYDSWNATEMAQKLSAKIEMIKFSMNVANFSEAMKKFDALIREGKVRHNGSPLLRWQILNVVAKPDHNSNLYPRKAHVRLKIDTVIAILMAIALWINQEETKSVYSSRGIRVL